MQQKLEKTFMQAFIENEKRADSINSYIEYWHMDNNIACSLRQFLGLTELEYSKWGKEEDEILSELKERRIALSQKQNTGSTQYFKDESGLEYFYIESDCDKHYTMLEG